VPWLEEDYRRTVADAPQPRLLPDSTVEIVREVGPGLEFRHVLFDFDGTLSLIREGWPEVMLEMMTREILATGTSEPAADVARLCREFVAELTGKQTIYQMIRLTEEIRRRGGEPREPVWYKEKYHARLMDRIRERREALRSGASRPEDHLVPGALGVLGALRDRGLPMYLASGTDRTYVEEEAGLLGLTPYFDGRVYGAADDYTRYSKQMVIEQILRENRVEGSSLLGFGDGYVEIMNVKAAGGVAVAVASDESGRTGRPDPWKRERLVGVGADIVVPDYRDGETLLAYLFRRE
jgi:phosphoglycolate phosphatase